MPAPHDNTNARKGEVNRQMWSQRLPVDVIESIKEQAEELDISQADYITALVRQPNTDEQLLELTGNETIEDLDEWFGGKSYEFILSEVKRCWPHEENNEEFAQELFERFGKLK